MVPQEYNFKTQRAGDTFSGVRMTCSRTSSGVESPIDLSGAGITMQVKKQSCLDPIIDLSVGSGITIEDGLNGIIRIDALLVPQVDSFNYIYDLQFTFPSGVVQTYLKGSFPINGDVTN